MEDMQNVLEEQREIKSKSNNIKEIVTPSERTVLSTQRRPPNPKTEENSGLSLLGAEYEQKKRKLQQELRSDYRQYVTQIQAPETVGLAAHYPLPPLPVAQPKAQRIGPFPEEQLPSRRDAATLTETGTGGERQTQQERRVWELYRPAVERPPEHWERRRRRRGRREEYTSEEDLSTEEEELEFLDRRRPRRSRELGSRERRFNYRSDRVPRERREVHPTVVREEVRRDGIRKSLSATPKPNLQMPAAMKTAERSTLAINKDQAEFATGLMIGAAEGNVASQKRKDCYRQDLLEQMAEQQRNKKMEKDLELRVAATGAIDPEKRPDRIKQFGAVNRDHEDHRRDLPYRPGLGLDTLGTNSRPRRREERPSVGREERGPPEKPRVAFPSPPLDYSTALRQLTGAGGPGVGLGAREDPGAGMGVPGVAPLNEELVVPRIASIPPPMPPTLTDAYRTPYDDAYYYYGARNPLDPSLPYFGPPGGGMPPLVLPNLPPGVPLPLGPHGRSGGTNQHGAAAPPRMGIGMIPGERPKQSKESVLNYQEALRQQIKEREERKRHEMEERERYDAKVEADMRAYDPWGKGGGGAPLKDNSGKLISDLNRMHRTNKEAYVNPQSRDRKDTRGSVGRRAPTPRVEDRVPSPHHISGFSFAQPSRFARGNVFTDQPTPQQLQEQDTYKDYLKQQIEEKRRKEEEEKDRIKTEEEREEKRLAEQRVCIQREYEEEQMRKKRKDMEQSTKNQETMRQAEEHRREAERKRREEEEGESETLRLQYESERQARLTEVQREPSPPIPALEKRLGKQHTTRPPSVVSQLSSRTVAERSVSAPHSPPVPARKNQLRATEDQQGVISELSALRRQLKSEQRRLEGQILQSDREEADTPIPTRHRVRLPVDVFDMARMRAQVSSRRPNSGGGAAAHVNMQNIREFNQLKYRDSASREEVRHVYPDPPIDEHSLDIQQQALLREQQRRIRSMRRRGEADYFEPAVERQSHHHHHHPREKPAHNHQKVSLLESESAFLDYPNGNASPGPVQFEQKSRQPSAQGRRRPSRRRDDDDEDDDDDDEMVTPVGQREYEGQPDAQSLFSVTSLNMEGVRDRNLQRIRRLDHLNDHDWRAGGLSADEGDDFSLRSSPYAPDRRVSVETVATEPWLRPGTSDTLKQHATVGQSRRERPSSRNVLDQEWNGPSTYHG